MAWYDPRTWDVRAKTLFSYRSVQQQNVRELQQRGREWRAEHGLPPRPRVETVQEQELGRRDVGIDRKKVLKKPMTATRQPIATMGGLPSFAKFPSFSRFKEFAGISTREQQKITQKELADVKRIESQYIKSGELRPTHEVIRPSDIGAIAGVYKEVGPQRPTPRLDYTYAGTKEYQRQISKVESLERQLKPHIVGGVYTSPAITEFERKWSGKIKGVQFVGSDVEYKKYQRELATTQRTQERELAPYTTATKRLEGMEPAYESRYAALTKEYDEYTRAREKQEELRGASIAGRAERAEEKTGKFIAARTPEWGKLPGIPQYERYKAWQESLIGKQMKEMGGMKTTGQIVESEFLKPIYMGIRGKPVKTAVTTAAFFALPPVLKGAKYAFKPVAKVGVKAFPRAAPWIGKWTPRAVGVGLGTAYAADVGRRVYAAPKKMRMEEFSKITGTELLPMGVGTYAAMKMPIRFATADITTGAKWRGIAFETPRTFRPIAGVIRGRPTIGEPLRMRMPTIPKAERIKGEDIFRVGIPRGGFEGVGAIPAKARIPSEVWLRPRAAWEMERGISMMQQMARTKPSARRPLREVEVKHIPSKAMPKVEAAIKKYEHVVYGSVVEEMYLAKAPKMARDIDLGVLPKDMPKIRSDLMKILKTEYGSKNVRKAVGGEGIEVKIGAEWRHAFDIHPLSSQQAFHQAPTFAVKLPKWEKINGITTVSLGEQWVKKGTTWLTPEYAKMGELGLKGEWRKKDIPGWSRISRDMEMAQMKSAKEARLFSATQQKKALKMSEELKQIRRI